MVAPGEPKGQSLHITLPELGSVQFGWAMCTNPACINFGVFYGGPEDSDRDNPRYSLVNRNSPKPAIKCKWCDKQHYVYSAASMRPLIRCFLRQSLPFADCPNTDCPNHGRNVFIHLDDPRGGSPRRYRKSTEHQVICATCKKSISLGVPLGLRKEENVRSRLKRVLLEIDKGTPLRSALKEGFTAGEYLRRVVRCAYRLNDYRGYLNARLQDPNFDFNKHSPLCVYTDTIRVSLIKQGNFPDRHQFLDVIVSVARVKRSYYIIAAHPYFLDDEVPSEEMIEDDISIDDPLMRKYRGIQTALDDRKTVTPEGTFAKGAPDTGQGGYFMEPYYAEAAHFAVVNHMLRRFPSVHFYMDANRVASLAALVAMREDIRSRRVEIALFQHDREAKSPRAAPANQSDSEALALAFAKAEGNIAGAAGVMGESATEVDARTYANIVRNGQLGANHERGKAAWLEFPRDNKQYRHCHTLWLTQRHGDTLHRGRALLSKSTLQPVDSAHSSMRNMIPSFGRPVTVAKGRGFSKSYRSVKIVCSELKAYLMFRNVFRINETEEQQRAPALLFDLVTPRGTLTPPVNIVRNFRLGVSHAKRLRKWMAS